MQRKPLLLNGIIRATRPGGPEAELRDRERGAAEKARRDGLHAYP